MALVFGGVQKYLDSRHLLRHSTSTSWNLPISSLLCLCKHLSSPSSLTKIFNLVALECSHSCCGYAVHSTLTGYVKSYQVCAIHSWAYHFRILPELTTASRLTLRDQKEFQTSFPV